MRSRRYTFSSIDFDGITVRGFREMMKDFPEDARITVETERVYGFGGYTDKEEESFVITWEE